MRTIFLAIFILVSTFRAIAQPDTFWGTYTYQEQLYDSITFTSSGSSPEVYLKVRTIDGSQLKYRDQSSSQYFNSNTTFSKLSNDPPLYIRSSHNKAKTLSIAIGQNVANLDVSGYRLLDSLAVQGISLSGLNVGSNYFLKYFIGNEIKGVNSMAFPHNENLQYLLLNGTALSSVDLSYNNKLYTIRLDSPNTSKPLTSINFGVPNAAALEFDARFQSLPQSEIDKVLKWLVDAGAYGGSCRLNGGSNSCPSSTGLAYVQILVGRNWNVVVNQCGEGGGGTTYPPSVTTKEPTYVSRYSATSGGVIISQGDASVTAKGVCWNTSPSPTTANSKTNDGSGSSEFTSSITGLSANTTYYVKAYATNTYGTSYGQQYSFTTLAEVTNPTLTTDLITGISNNGATSGGHIISDGGDIIVEKGICWNTSGAPTYSDTKTNEGSGTADFVSTLTGLSPNTTYYVRAYARNRTLVGGFYVYALGYGQQETFTTTGGGILPTVETYIANSITINSAYSGGNVSSDGGYALTNVGLVWSAYVHPTTTSFPTGGIMPSGNNTGSFIAQMPNLYSGTKYYYKAYATNTVGTAYGEEFNFTTLLPDITSSYGYLYNWNAAIGDINGDGTIDSNIAASGWHLPTKTDVETLVSYLGASTAGSKLKESGTTYWNSTNTGTNVSLFYGRGGGYRVNTGSFADLKNRAQYWTSTAYNSTDAYFLGLIHDYAETFLLNINKKYGHTIRLIKDSTSLINGQTSTYTGNDGRIYATICIGTQEWLSVDLKETMWRNGTIIPEVQNGTDWSSSAAGARCYYVP